MGDDLMDNVGLKRGQLEILDYREESMKKKKITY